MTEVHNRPSLEDVGAVELFEKVLTSSDANSQGRVIIPKAQAMQHLPPLLDTSAVEIPCQDTCGTEHFLKYHTWVNNQSRMFLLEGLQGIKTVYGLRVGDSLVFGSMPDGTLVIGGRERQGPLPPSRASIMQDSPDVNLDRSKRRKRGQPYDPSEYDLSWKAPPQDPLVPEYEPQLDGVFRAVPKEATDFELGVSMENGTWVANVSLGGEPYQACFESQASAQEAFEAAGVAAF